MLPASAAMPNRDTLRRRRVVIAGCGTIGSFLARRLEPRHVVVKHDPPKGLHAGPGLSHAEAVLICVPTPSDRRGITDLSAVVDVLRLIPPTALAVCHSTLPPGGTDRLSEQFGRTIVYVPEFAGELASHPYRSIRKRNFCIIGSPDEVTANDVWELISPLYARSAVIKLLNPLEAEIVKMMENSFLATKVAFCNEFFDICESFGVEYERVRSAVSLDGRIGPSHTLVTSERGFGGKCLPKDLRTILATAQSLGVHADILRAVRTSNERLRVELDSTREATKD